MIALLGAAAALLAAAFFALAERTVLSAGRFSLRRWVVERRSGDGFPGQEALDRPLALLAPVLFGHTLAVTIAAWLVAEALEPLARGPLATAALTCLVVVPPLYLLGEVVADAVASGRAPQILPLAARALGGFRRAFAPFLAVGQALVGSMLARLGLPPPTIAGGRRSLERLLAEGERAGVVAPSEREIIAGVFEFGFKRVGEVMTPASRIVSAPYGATAAEIAEVVRRTGYSRIPLEGRLEGRVIGMVHVFDLFDSPPDRRPRARPVVTTRPEKPCDEVLVEMRRRRCHLAIVTEERRTVGMVTLEDLIEELVGDIHDEHD